MNKKDFLHYGQQKIEQDDIDSVIKVLKSDFLTTGPIVKKFEEDDWWPYRKKDDDE